MQVSDPEHRLFNDPPQMFVRWEPDERHDPEGPGEVEWGVALPGEPERVLESEGYASKPDGEDDQRRDAWAWHDRRHVLAERLASRAHYKAHNDPPGMWSGQARGEHPGGYGYALMESSHEHPLEADFERIDDARAAAWAWYDRRLALHGKASNDQRHRIDFCGSCGAENEPQEDDECPECSATSCLISTWGEQQAERYRTGERYTANDPDIDDASPTWPRCLTWSDEQVAEVERWLTDSTAEMPEVLRG